MVDPAHAVLAGELVELVDQGRTPSSSRPSRADGLATVESDLDFLGLVGSQPGIDGPLERLGRRLDPGIFEDPGLDRPAPQVLVGAEDRLLGRLDLDAVLRGVLQLLRPRPLPFANRRDDLQVGASVWNVTSNRTWSFPLPVQPWATAAAPCSRATRTMSWAIRGRPRAVASGYFPS